jgi:hypothetical protein
MIIKGLDDGLDRLPFAKRIFIIQQAVIAPSSAGIAVDEPTAA